MRPDENSRWRPRLCGSRADLEQELRHMELQFHGVICDNQPLSQLLDLVVQSGFGRQAFPQRHKSNLLPHLMLEFAHVLRRQVSRSRLECMLLRGCACAFFVGQLPPYQNIERIPEMLKKLWQKRENLNNNGKKWCAPPGRNSWTILFFSLMFTDFPYVFYRVTFIFIDFHSFHWCPLHFLLISSWLSIDSYCLSIDVHWHL